APDTALVRVMDCAIGRRRPSFGCRSLPTRHPLPTATDHGPRTDLAISVDRTSRSQAQIGAPNPRQGVPWGGPMRSRVDAPSQTLRSSTDPPAARRERHGAYAATRANWDAWWLPGSTLRASEARAPGSGLKC